MTENKQYILIPFEEGNLIFKDDGGEFFNSVDCLKDNEIVDLLNEQEERIKKLSEENEQLKKEIDKLKHRHSLLHDVCIEAECDRDRYHKDVVSLEKEMEQLKSTNMEMEDYLGRLEEANINLQIKLQKIRDYAKEDGEVKQGIIEKVIMND